MPDQYTTGPGGATYQQRQCAECGTPFRYYLKHEQLDKGSKGLYCSRACHHAVQRREATERLALTEKRCTKCGNTKPITDFAVNKERRHSWCTECAYAAKQAYKAANREHVRNRDLMRRRAQREAVIARYSNGTNRCACCGESQFEFLAIDHIDGGGTQHRAELKRKGTGMITWLAKAGYPEGYQVLCHNCNMAKGFYGECPHERERREAVMA